MQKNANKKIIVTPVSEVHLSNDVDEAEKLTEEELHGVGAVALHWLLMIWWRFDIVSSSGRRDQSINKSAAYLEVLLDELNPVWSVSLLQNLFWLWWSQNLLECCWWWKWRKSQRNVLDQDGIENKIFINRSIQIKVILHLRKSLVGLLVLFSCPGQLNRWPCHSLTHSLSESGHFWFHRLWSTTELL